MENINSILKTAIETLTKAGVDAPAFDARELLAFTMELPKTALLLTSPPPTEVQLQQFSRLITRRAKRYPLQYLLGFWEFYGRKFYVREGVLIPRPDTEILLEEALSWLPKMPQAVADSSEPAVLELCAGSGAVAISLSLEAERPVAALEISPAAIEVLRENVALHGAAVSVIAADALTFSPTHCYGMILANPPYIDPLDYDALAPELFFEPKMALTAPERGYYFYREIATRYRSALLPGGLLLFECGIHQAAEIGKILEKAGYRVLDTVSDLCGIPRVLVAVRGN